MNETVYRVLDPSGYQWSQLLPRDRAVRSLVALLAERLALPGELRYELVHRHDNRVLPDVETLEQAGIPDGSELVLRPAPTTESRAFLEQLYEEAKGFVAEQAWEQAQDLLGKLFRLDPNFADAGGLCSKLSGLRAAAKAASRAPTPPGQGGGPAGSQPPPSGGTPPSGGGTTTTGAYPGGAPSSGTTPPPPYGTPPYPGGSPPPPVTPPGTPPSSGYPGYPPGYPGGGQPPGGYQGYPGGGGYPMPPSPPVPPPTPSRLPTGGSRGATAKGCLSPAGWVAVIIVGVVGVGLAIQEGILPSPFRASNRPPISQPGGQRPGEPTLGTGDVQVTLRWNNGSDVDLHVFDPANEEIYFSHRNAASGGVLDVDANAGCGATTTPVENVYWPTGQSPSGTYRVEVVYFSPCGEPSTDYEVEVRVDGQLRDSQRGTLTQQGERVTVAEFTR